jgi:transcriptional regulator with XRE-family HTH domain
MATVVDPRFGARLREFRRARGLSLRQLAARIPVSYPYISQLEAGLRCPSSTTAARLDAALDAGGELAAMVVEIVAPSDHDRVVYATAHPRRVDMATMDALADALAALRRLDDTLGAAAVLPVADRQRIMVAVLARHARAPIHSQVVGMLGQWCQFQGWLHLSGGQVGRATAMFSRALAAAAEAGDRELAATTLSFRGYTAYLAGAVGSAAELTRAALAHPDIYIGQRAYDYHQLARALAMAGDQSAARAYRAEAVDLAAAATEHAGPRPPWHYYRIPAVWALEDGVTLRRLGDRQRAAERIHAGLMGLPAQWQAADWLDQYRAVLSD